MSDGKHLFIYLKGGQNPFQVDIPGSVNNNARQIFVQAYVFKGVPTVSGSPNSIFYNLNTENSDIHFNQLLRNDNRKGVPLPLDRSDYTSRVMQPMLHIADYQNSKPLLHFTLRITDENGKDALFESAAVWLFIK